jgi:hypothetical protein
MAGPDRTQMRKTAASSVESVPTHIQVRRRSAQGDAWVRVKARVL